MTYDVVRRIVEQRSVSDKIKTRWDRVKQAGAIISVAYTVSNPVRKPDGSIDFSNTAIQYLNIGRRQIGLPAVPLIDRRVPNPNEISTTMDADGVISMLPPIWIADP